MPDPNESFDVDYLGDSPEGDLQYKPDNSGTERVRPQDAYTGPSLSGPIPRYGHSGQRGLGGSLVSDAMQGKASEHGKHTQDHDVNLTPEAIMAKANELENNLLAQRLDGSTAVDPALIRAGYVTGEPPDWLREYMEAQPDPGSMSFGGTTVVDRVGGQKYLSEQERLKLLKFAQMDKGLK